LHAESQSQHGSFCSMSCYHSGITSAGLPNPQGKTCWKNSPFILSNATEVIKEELNSS